MGTRKVLIALRRIALGGTPVKWRAQRRIILAIRKPSSPEDARATQCEDGSCLLDGSMSVSELKHRLALGGVPEEERGRCNTLSGMVMLQLGRLPRTADRCEWQDLVFEVVDIDGKRVDKVLATRKPKDCEGRRDRLAGGGHCT